MLSVSPIYSPSTPPPTLSDHSELPPLSLYIHLPWCLKKCPYCDFNSHAQPAGGPPQQPYIEALIADLERDQLSYLLKDKRVIHSIFIGGGTPSLFEPKWIAHLLDAIQCRFSVQQGCEITLEANPGTFEYQRFLDFKGAGVNRLSIGIQSFNQTYLDALGRVHSSKEALQAVEIASQCGFEQINIDLMHGLPGQSVEDALFDLKQGIAFNTTHLSWYQLTIEPNTPFYLNRPQLPDENCLWGIEQRGKELLAESSFLQYETSAYAKAGGQCQHNLNYWRFGDYLGIGCGAHGKLTQLSETSLFSIFRTEKVRSPHAYMSDPASQLKTKQVMPEELAFEFFMNRFRLEEPCPKTDFFQYIDWKQSDEGGHSEKLSAMASLDRAIEKGLIIEDELYWQVTPKGALFLNDLLSLFL